MQLNPYHLFQHDGSHVMINIDKMTVCRVEDNAILTTLHDIRGNPSTHVGNIMEQELKKLNLIPYRKVSPYIERKQEVPPIGHVVLFVSHECNMKCIYCSGPDGYKKNAGSGTLKRDTALNSVDWLIEQSGDLEQVSIGFFGGEPFLNFPVIKEAVLYAHTREKQTGKKFRFSVVTNGSILNSDNITFIKEHEIGLTVSFDGPKNLQDTQRPFKNGKGSYDLVIDKIRNLLLALPNTRVRATLMGANNPIVVENSLREIGFKDVVIDVVSPRGTYGSMPCQGCSDRDYSGIQNWEMLRARRLLEAIKGRRIASSHKETAKSFLMGLFIQQFLSNLKKYYPCGAGKYHVAISSSGDVYLCHRFVGVEEYKLGSIFNSELDRAFYVSATVESNDRCSKCFARYLCSSCYHENLLMRGSIFKPAEDTCAHIRNLAELAASFCCHLQEDDKAFLIREEIISKPPWYIDLF